MSPIFDLSPNDERTDRQMDVLTVGFLLSTCTLLGINCIIYLLFPFNMQISFNDNFYQEGNISTMPDFDLFSLLEIRKR